MRVLTIVHGFPPHAMGGSEVYAYALAQAVRNAHGADSWVLTRHASPDRPEYDVVRERRDGLNVVSVNNNFRACESFEDSYRHQRIRRIAAELIDDVQPDVAHIHHLTCLSTEVVSELAERGIPIVFTLHDYWLICHRGQLLDLDYQLCSGPYDGGCRRCVGATGQGGPAMSTLLRAYRAVESRLPTTAATGLRQLAQSAARVTDDWSTSADESMKRLQHMRSMSEMVTQFLAPSETMLRYFVQFGIPGHRIQHWPYGFDAAPFREVARSASDRLRIGFFGSLMISKAPHLVLQAFSGLPRGRASLSLFGKYSPYHGDDGYRQELQSLLASTDLAFTGAVRHEEIPQALASLDVVVVPSIWPENSPLVISEAFLAGVPVVGSNLGGVAEMIRHEHNGLLFEPGSSDDLRRCLERLIDERDLLPRLRAGLPPVRSIDDDAAKTYELYQSVAPSKRQRTMSPKPARRARLAAVVLNYRTPSETFLAVKSLQASRREIDDIIVVDNGSGDDSVERLRALLDEVTVVAGNVNRGFSGGCNEGITKALERGADMVFLVNSDTIVPPDAVAELERALSAGSEAGIAGPLVLSRNEPDQIGSAGMSFSRITGRMRHAGFGERYGSYRQRPTAIVDGVSGCAMLVKREVFEQIGLLDMDYFFSFEDLDFCLRARRAGFQTICVAAAVAYHEGSRSIGRESASRIYYATRNHLLLASRAARWADPARRLIQTAGILTANLAYVVVSSEARLGPGLGSFLSGIRDHARGRYGDVTSRSKP